jgi:hypothetical protein
MLFIFAPNPRILLPPFPSCVYLSVCVCVSLCHPVRLAVSVPAAAPVFSAASFCLCSYIRPRLSPSRRKKAVNYTHTHTRAHAHT